MGLHIMSITVAVAETSLYWSCLDPISKPQLVGTGGAAPRHLFALSTITVRPFALGSGAIIDFSNYDLREYTLLEQEWYWLYNEKEL